MPRPYLLQVLIWLYLEKFSLAQEVTRNKDLATEKMAKAKTPIVADELYGGINTETTFRFGIRFFWLIKFILKH